MGLVQSIITTAVDVVNGVDTAVKAMQRVAGSYQAIDDNHYAKGWLDNILIFSAKGQYGSDYAFYWPDHFGAAIGMMDGNDSGDLYLLEVTDEAFSTCRYNRVLVYAKFGLTSNIANTKAVREIAKLPKRSGVVPKEAMEAFLQGIVSPTTSTSVKVPRGGGNPPKAM